MGEQKDTSKNEKALELLRNKKKEKPVVVAENTNDIQKQLEIKKKNTGNAGKGRRVLKEEEKAKPRLMLSYTDSDWEKIKKEAEFNNIDPNKYVRKATNLSLRKDGLVLDSKY